jgi:hypothetical protein
MAIEECCTLGVRFPGRYNLASGEEGIMPKSDLDLISLLKAELDFLEAGGYGRSVRTPWKPTSIFQDSLTCLNFGDPERTHPCSECLLIDFVPPEHRHESVPCHHIPLTATGKTVATIEQKDDQSEAEEKLKNWLRETIARLEKERDKPA